MEGYFKYLNEFKQEKKWIKEFVFYKISPQQVDLQNDWRFKEVKDKRKQLIPL